MKWKINSAKVKNSLFIKQPKYTQLMSSLGRSSHILLSLIKSLFQSVKSQLQVLMTVARKHHSEPPSLLRKE